MQFTAPSIIDVLQAVTDGHFRREGKATPSTHLVLKIADLFGVTTDQLMRDELEVD